MIEIKGDLFSEPGDVICITTNGVVKSDGLLVMGAGVAKKAIEHPDIGPELAWHFGGHIKRHGNTPCLVQAYLRNNVYPETYFHVISFPTKHHWRNKSDINLIRRSAEYIRAIVDQYRWTKILSTRPGCGHGQLTWDQVKPVLEPIFDNRFYIITP